MRVESEQIKSAVQRRFCCWAMPALVAVLAMTFANAAVAKVVGKPSFGDFAVQQSLQDQINVYSLHVGINDYRFISPLDGAVADARSFERLFRSAGVAETMLLADEDATRENIVKSLREIGRKAKLHDLVVFTFAGHCARGHSLGLGDTNDSLDEFAALPGFDLDSPRWHDAIFDDEFATLFGEFNEGVMRFLVFDCTNSGTIIGDAVFGPTVFFAGAPYDSTAAQETRATGETRGVLSLALAEALAQQGAAGLLSGRVSLSQLERIRSQVLARAGELTGGRQNPVISFNEAFVTQRSSALAPQTPPQEQVSSQTPASPQKEPAADKVAGVAEAEKKRIGDDAKAAFDIAREDGSAEAMQDVASLFPDTFWGRQAQREADRLSKERQEAAAAVAAARADRRVALLIGNGAYAHTSTLANPENDVFAMSEALAALGFDVTVLKDAGRLAFGRALQDFQEQAEGVDTALIFYSGHGMEINGRNFLIPVDATLRREGDATLEALPMDMALNALSGATRLSALILDACRTHNFPSSERSTARGFAPVGARAGQVVVFSTEAGRVAYDGAGAMSPFTQALTEALAAQPHEDVRLLFTSLGARTSELAEAAQEPFARFGRFAQGVAMPLSPLK